MINITLNDFRIFQSVAEHGSFSKAALLNNTVQSNVSARIKYLEEQFKCELINRTTKKLTITDAGIKLLKTAKEVQLLVEKTQNEINGNTNEPSGIIKIGCLHTTAALRAPGILGEFTDAYPAMEFRLKTDTTAHLVKDVLSYKVDGAFISGEINHPDIISEKVLIEQLGLISSPLIPNWEELINGEKVIKLIVFNTGCYYRGILLKILAEHGIKKYKIIEIDILDAVVNSIEQGIGIGILPIDLIKQNYKYRNLSILKVDSPHLKCPTMFIRRKDVPISNGYQLFLEKIIEGYAG